jgi:hypothetical protein
MEDEMGGACTTNWREEEHLCVIGEKAEGKRPLGRPRHRWGDNIKMDLEEIKCEIDCIGLAQDRGLWRAFVNAVTNLQVP